MNEEIEAIKRQIKKINEDFDQFRRKQEDQHYIMDDCITTMREQIRDLEREI